MSNVKEDEEWARGEAAGKDTCSHTDGLSLNPGTHRRCVWLYPFYFEISGHFGEIPYNTFRNVRFCKTDHFPWLKCMFCVSLQGCIKLLINNTEKQQWEHRGQSGCCEDT